MPSNSNNPACGSGGMFVQSGKFVESHGGPAKWEIRSAKSERRLPGPFAIRHSPFAIRHSTFPHAPPRAASPL